jgi:hypothetical protein
LALIVIVVAYSVGISQVIPSQKESFILGYYGTAIIAFFFAIALVTGGVMVLKSDRDYLFTLPLSTRDLSISIFFSQFIAFGITILFMFIYLVQSLASVLILVDLIALALTFTSLGILATTLTTKVRAALGVMLALWTLLSFANFPLSPGSAFNGNVYGGTATLIALAGVTCAAAFRGLSHVELDMMRSLVRTTSPDIKSPKSYAGKTPLGAIYSMNLSTISFAGRLNMAGTSRYVTRRVQTRWVVTVTSAAAAAYFAFVLYTGPPRPLLEGAGTLPAAILISIFLSFITFFFSQSAITNERMWLSLTSLPPATYFRHLIASRVISLLFIITPFAIADAVLLALGYDVLGALAVVSTVVPGAFILEILWAAYVAPIQVKGDDLSMPGQFNLKQMAAALPLAPVFFLASIATVIPIIAFGGGIVLVVVSISFTLSRRFWGKVVTRLTENGFV